jgi:hypothetical protein
MKVSYLNLQVHFNLKIEAANPSETSVYVDKTTTRMFERI